MDNVRVGIDKIRSYYLSLPSKEKYCVNFALFSPVKIIATDRKY